MTVLVDHGEADQDSGGLYVEGSLTATVEVDLPPNSGVILVFLSGSAAMGLRYKDIEFECEEAEITAVSHSYDGGDEGTWRMVHIVSIGLPEGYTGTLTINVTCGWWDYCVPFSVSMASYYNAFSGVSGESFELQDAVLQDFSPDVHTTSIGVVNELYEGMAMWVGATFDTSVEYSENVDPQSDIYRDGWFAKVATAPLADHGNEVIASITEADDFQQMFFAAGFPLYSFDQPGPPEPCILPNMVGMQLEAAESSLEETTFILGDVTEEESEVDEGLVLSQSLSPGEQECGATVNLVVSSGPGGCFDCECSNTNSTLEDLRARLTTALGFKAQLAQQTGVPLSAFRKFLAQRLGFAATADNLPPGAQALFDNFVNDAQQIVWRQYAFDAYGAEAPTAMVAGSDTCTLDAEAIRLFALMLGKGYYGKTDANLARDLAAQYLEDLTKRGPPNLKAVLTEKLHSAQTFLYFKYPALRTRYIFRWEMEQGVRFYGLCDTQNNICDLSFSPYKSIEGAWLIDLNGAWLPMAAGIPPAMYTTLNNNSLPTRYEIRQCLEVFPPPSADGYQVAIKGHFGLLPFEADMDKTTIDSELVFLWALYEAKLQYQQPDAAAYSDKARERIGDLTAGTHGSRRYIPGTRPRAPAVMPVFEDS